MDNAKNFAKVRVATGYDDVATTVVLSSGEGSKLPTAPFNVVWWNSTDYPDPSDDPNKEICRVTNVATDTLTLTRAQEGTTASDKNTDGKVYRMIAGLTAKVINEDLVDFFNVEAFTSTQGVNTFTTAKKILKVLLVSINQQPLPPSAYTVALDGSYVQTVDDIYPAGMESQVIYIG